MTQEANGTGAAWERQQISFWLTPQRRRDLLTLAQGLPAGATPSDAIASAITAARSHLQAGRPDSADFADAIDSAVANGLSETRKAVASHGQAIAEMEKGLRSIHALLAALAGEEGLREADGMDALDAPALPATTQTFRQWLEASLARAGGRPKRSAVAKATPD